MGRNAFTDVSRNRDVGQQNRFLVSDYDIEMKQCMNNGVTWAGGEGDN